jgi:predicted CXXCH cytochrome family protein
MNRASFVRRWWFRGPLRLICAPLLIIGIANASAGGYVGSDVCAGCHKEIAATQSQTKMRRTWHDASTTQIPTNYAQKFSEGPAPNINYSVRRTGPKDVQFQVQMPGQQPVSYPVITIVGGERHGLVFLVNVPSLQGSELPRPALNEGRYFQSVRRNGLALELGLPEEKPTTYETSIGRVLPPVLEKRCLSCHTGPRTLGTRVETGVACENCHGPGQPHLLGLASHSKDLGILNPAKLPVAERMRPCMQCHAGTTFIEDAMPDETLISAQVVGLKNSECWRQSEGQITCLNCHNPHQDASRVVLVARAEKTCLTCHTLAVKNHAALCPVSRATGCVTCHMPDKVSGAFVMAEHWIRVHPEQNVKVPGVQNAAWRTTVVPKHLYLRKIELESREKAASILQQFANGASFFDVARADSLDRETGANGGYTGDLTADKLAPGWAAVALRLQPGQISNVVEANGRYVILQRMPRNFRFDAKVKFDEAMSLRKAGKPQESVAKLLEALKIYPHFLRALTYLGISFSEMGNPQTGANILQIATKLYPQDEGAHFNLGVAYGALGSEEEVAEYKKTIEIDPDYDGAYLNWGGVLYNKGQLDEAIELYRRGLQVNPLNPALHYSLSAALGRVRKKDEADAEAALAGKIDPKYASR